LITIGFDLVTRIAEEILNACVGLILRSLNGFCSPDHIREPDFLVALAPLLPCLFPITIEFPAGMGVPCRFDRGLNVSGAGNARRADRAN
jgi:hypothetical protein